MLIGYERVSTTDQNLSLQHDALSKAGCKKIYRDIASASKDSREGLNKALEALREGDTLVVWRLDRLGRSLRHLIDVVGRLNEDQIGLMSLQEKIDTTTSGGKLVFHIFGALAEFEREVIRERTRAGLAAARTRGRKGGRPIKFGTKQVERAKRLLDDPETTVREVCKTLGISKATLYRRMSQMKSQD